MKHRTLICGLVLTAALASPPVMAGEAINHSAQAVAHLIQGSAKLVAGVVAVPLQLAGAVGEASGRAGDELSEFANQPATLPVAEETVTVGPSPAEALHGGGGS